MRNYGCRLVAHYMANIHNSKLDDFDELISIGEDAWQTPR